MRIPALLVILGLIAANLLSTSEVQADWFPNLNPFSQKTAIPETPRAQPAKVVPPQKSITDDDSGWEVKLPKPPSLSGIGQGVKRAFTNTVDFLNPWDSEPEKPSGMRTATRQDSSGSTWSNWFGSGKEETEKPQSPTDFLRMPRPDFD